MLSLGGYVLWMDREVRTQFEGKRWQVPARIFARPLELYPGAVLDAAALERELRIAGYQPGSDRRPGGFTRKRGSFRINVRKFRYWDAEEPARRLEIVVVDGRVTRLRGDGRPLSLVRLEPALIGRIYPAHGEDRILVRLEEVPPTFVKALLATEDRGFYRHMGVSLRSVLRALWVNIRAGQTVQGGSTITQQLAKNFYLTPERTLTRKLNEALIALLLEFRYQKSEILEAYLNEVYLGQQGRRAIHGFGLAARHYFGRRLIELETHEMALVVALVRGPSYYNPRLHGERARGRRNLILDTMAEQGAIGGPEATAAKRRPLGVLATAPPGRSAFPAFLDLVRRQLRRDYRDADLRGEGLRIFTTLHPLIQRRAEAALSAKVRQLETRSGRLKPGMLQGAVVVTRASSAEVLAVVGGRDAREAGFNRALDAVRPVGSLIKPAVYLAALEQPGRYHLATPLDDATVELKDRRGNVWSPKNYDGEFHGRVPLYEGLAKSYNLATVNLGMELGLSRVADALRRLGVERKVALFPSMLLGAVELSPLNVTQMYQTIADGGFRTPLRAIREVTDARGRPLSRYPLRVTQSVAAGPAYLLMHAMQAVMRVGTGRSAYENLPASITSAGKTGTTDDLRDSWFAGFTGDHLAVVWLGRDDNGPTNLSGATGALKVWTELMSGISTSSLSPPTPDNVMWATFDPDKIASGRSGCDRGLRLPFIRGFEPSAGRCGDADVQGGWDPDAAADRH
jgi:penicillin-binding protein 1B